MATVFTELLYAKAEETRKGRVPNLWGGMGDTEDRTS